MNAKKLLKVSIKYRKKEDRFCTSKREVDSILLKIAKVGMSNTRVYLKQSRAEKLCKYLVDNGFQVFFDKDKQGNCFAEVSWFY